MNRRVTVQCDNCEWTGPEADLGRTLGEIHHLAERLDPGGIVPAGECPECQCLAYPVTVAARLDVTRKLALLVNAMSGFPETTLHAGKALPHINLDETLDEARALLQEGKP